MVITVDFNHSSWDLSGEVTGNFTGEDLDSNSLLSLEELSSFSLDSSVSVTFGSFSHDLSDLGSFSYDINSNVILDIQSSDTVDLGGEVVRSYVANDNSGAVSTVSDIPGTGTSISTSSVGPSSTPVIDPVIDTIDLFRFRNTNFETGTYVFVGAEERDAILADPDLSESFELEGRQPDGSISPAFTASTQPGDDLLPFFRLQSLETPGTFLFVSRGEYDAIFAEDSNQKDKWEQEGLDSQGNDIPEFYLFGAGAGQGPVFNRFQNQENNTFLFASPEETASINSNPDLSGTFLDRDSAFESLI